MKLVFVVSTLLASVLLLSACSPEAPTRPAAQADTESAPTSVQAQPSQTLVPVAPGVEAHVDEQGSVVVEVLPMNLNEPGETLDFQVSMDTHSVDLSMDLAALATLATDTGLQVEAVSWVGPRGGHHVSGMLLFPSSLDGKTLLEGASRITLTIRSVDAEARVFTWDLIP